MFKHNKKIKVMLREEIKKGLNQLFISLFMLLIIAGEFGLFYTGKVEVSLNIMMIFSIITIIGTFFILLNSFDLAKHSYKRIISIIKVNKLSK